MQIAISNNLKNKIIINKIWIIGAAIVLWYITT